MVILNESKIKYDKLDELLEEQLNDIRFSQQVSIIVDVKEVIKKLFRPDIMTEITNPRALMEEISSDIINIVGHYRNYFYKKGKYSNFYFLYSYDKCSELIQKMPNYKSEYYSKYFDDTDNSKKIEIVKKSIKAVEKVLSVIPNTMFIDTSKHDELVYGKYITEKIPKNQLVIILTNDPIMYQLLDKNIFGLDVKGINSKLVSTNNAVSILAKRETTISSNLLPLVLALSGDKKYSFKGIPHVALIKASQIVESLVSRGITLDINSIEIPIDFTKLKPSETKLDASVFGNKDQLEENYALIRNDENLSKNMLFIETELTSKKPRKEQLSYFLELNAKIYTLFPLQLDMLLKGEKI